MATRSAANVRKLMVNGFAIITETSGLTAVPTSISTNEYAASTPNAAATARREIAAAAKMVRNGSAGMRYRAPSAHPPCQSGIEMLSQKKRRNIAAQTM